MKEHHYWGNYISEEGLKFTTPHDCVFTYEMQIMGEQWIENKLYFISKNKKDVALWTMGALAIIDVIHKRTRIL